MNLTPNLRQQFEQNLYTFCCAVDGSEYWDQFEYLMHRFEEQPLPPNVGSLVGIHHESRRGRWKHTFVWSQEGGIDEKFLAKLATEDLKDALDRDIELLANRKAQFECGKLIVRYAPLLRLAPAPMAPRRIQVKTFTVHVTFDEINRVYKSRDEMLKTMRRCNDLYENRK